MSASETLVGQKIGNYVVVSQLGRGGMGEVYLAEHPQIGRKVAIKVLAADLLTTKELALRFLSEAKAVARIEHPNVIEIYDFGTLENGRPYYVMEVLKGRELRDLLDARGKLTAAELLPYLEQICAGLQAAHDCGVVHRDLKPENIFVLDRQPLALKVLDFGIAKILEKEQGSGLTSLGMVMGTPLFIAPEQALGLPERISPRTDIYSLGVVLYAMLAGRPPFMDEAPAVLLAMHIRDAPPPLRELEPSVPSPIAALVERCLHKEPERRPASAAELAQTFATLVAQECPAPPPRGATSLTVEKLASKEASSPLATARTEAAAGRTTFSKSVGEVANVEGLDRLPRRSTRKWVVGAIVLATIVGLAVTFRSLGEDASSSSPPDGAASTTAPSVQSRPAITTPRVAIADAGIADAWSTPDARPTLDARPTPDAVRAPAKPIQRVATRVNAKRRRRRHVKKPVVKK
ncbi:MAG: serine/threonine protein kinase, partial [Deltaproteobacteria bacterium]|nr:serine/threonine protein kinase [Deltaproteobacteria bacterium]